MIIRVMLLLLYLYGRIICRDIILFDKLHHFSLRPFRMIVGSAALAVVPVCC
jgi:hypothetical protein